MEQWCGPWRGSGGGWRERMKKGRKGRKGWVEREVCGSRKKTWDVQFKFKVNFKKGFSCKSLWERIKRAGVESWFWPRRSGRLGTTAPTKRELWANMEWEKGL